MVTKYPDKVFLIENCFVYSYTEDQVAKLIRIHDLKLQGGINNELDKDCFCTSAIWNTCKIWKATYSTFNFV